MKLSLEKIRADVNCFSLLLNKRLIETLVVYEFELNKTDEVSKHKFK